MKRLYFAFLSIILFAVAGFAQTTPNTHTYTYTANNSNKITQNGDQVLNGITWNVTSNAKYFGFNGGSDPKIQIGTTKTQTKLTLTTKGIKGTITNVKMVTSGTKKLKGTFGVTVNGIAYGSPKAIIGTTKNNFEFTGSEAGEIKMTWDNTDDAAIYIHSFTIEYTDGGGVTPQPETVATPTFDPAAGSVAKETSVSINCATQGAEIRYTLNGTEPTETSTLYNNPIVINEKTTIKAIAIKGTEKSAVATATYEITSTTGYQFVPATTIESGKRYIFVHGTGQNTNLVIRNKKILAIGEKLKVENGIAMVPDLNNAFSITKEGTNTFTIIDNDGQFYGTNNNNDFNIQPERPKEMAAFLWTIEIDANSSATTIKNNNRQIGYNSQSPRYAPYKNQPKYPLPHLYVEYNPNQVLAPTFKTPAGEILKGTKVELEPGTVGSTIYYTFDKTKGWTKYTGPIALPDGETTIWAYATKDTMDPSPEVSATYTVILPTLETPVISPAAGEYLTTQLITVTAVEGASVYYTTDGKTPTEKSTQYTAPFELGKACTVKALAVMAGYNNSAVAEAKYTILKVATPEITTDKYDCFEGEPVHITVTCATEGAVITYSIDNGQTYIPYPAAGFDITENCTIMAKATLAGATDSGIASKKFTFKVDTRLNSIVEFYNNFTVADVGTSVEFKVPLTVVYSYWTGELTNEEGKKYNQWNIVLMDQFGRFMHIHNQGVTKQPTDLVNGQVIDAGLSGTIDEFHGIIELRADAKSIVPGEVGNVVLPKELELSQLQTEDNYEYKYVVFRDITLDVLSTNDLYSMISQNRTEVAYDAFHCIQRETVGPRYKCDAEGFLGIHDGVKQLNITQYIQHEILKITPVITGVHKEDGDYYEITITCDEPDAQIYFTLDGSTPTFESTLYKNKFAIHQSCTVKAIAVKSGFSDSDVVSEEFILNHIPSYKGMYNFTQPKTELHPEQKIPAIGESIAINDIVFRVSYTSLVISSGKAKAAAKPVLFGKTDGSVELVVPAGATITVKTSNKNNSLNRIVFNGSNYDKANVTSTSSDSEGKSRGTLSGNEWTNIGQYGTQIVPEIIFTFAKETRINTIDVYSDIVTGVENAERDNFSVHAVNGGVVVKGEGNAEVYNIYGQLVAHEFVEGEATISTPSGLMIVKAGNTVTKVLVK